MVKVKNQFGQQVLKIIQQSNLDPDKLQLQHPVLVQTPMEKKHGESMSSPTTDISLLVPVCIDLRIALYQLCYGNIKVIIIIIASIHDNVLFIETKKNYKPRECLRKTTESRRDQVEGGELGSHEEVKTLSRVQARSRGGRWCWTYKLAQKRSRVGRWRV